jgi:hypothetical protein
VILPSEAVLTFRLNQPTQVATLSQAEMDRLGYGVPVGGAAMPRRYAPPPPYVYGPVFYPRYYPRYYRAYPY